jgi:hypothetical protein
VSWWTPSPGWENDGLSSIACEPREPKSEEPAKIEDHETSFKSMT